MVNNDLYLDTRLQEKSLRDGKLGRDALKGTLDGLADAAENMVAYDDEGNATNMPERELKILEVKPEEPIDVLTVPIGLPIDPLADAWEG
ncbi:MAG: hypothetical protein ACI9OJ_001726 [Myxococcota bacterium]|jgi:hypothetical protein